MAESKRKMMIYSVISGIIIITAGVLIPVYYFVWRPTPVYTTWDLMFYGDEVDTSVNVSYQHILGRFPATSYSFNQTKWWTPDGYESEIQNFTGVPLWDLIDYSGVDYGRANALRFIGIDGWTSPELSIEDIENNKSLIIVYYEEEGETLTGPADGGDGYLMSAVNYSINEAKKSSHYNVKGLVGIEFIIDWDVKLFGDSLLVEENKTISYTDIITDANFTRVNTLINYTTPGVSSVLRNVTGVTLWSLIQETGINYTSATHVNFIASDGFSTYNVSLNDIGDNENEVLIVFEEDGVLLDPLTDGYLMSIVDFSVTEGYDVPKSGRYNSKFLTRIEFVDLIT